MNFTGVSLPDVTMVTRGCVLKMYHCGLKMDELRNIFWETGAVAIDPSSSDRSMEVCDECVSRLVVSLYDIRCVPGYDLGLGGWCG